MAAAVHAKKKGAIVIANLAPYLALETNFFNSVDYLILNESEASQLSQDLSIESDEIEEIAKASGCGVIKTLGVNGIEVVDEHTGRFSIPGVKIDALDTVGAGDTFAGYLGAMLGSGHSLHSACEVANSAAALACMKSGAQTAIPTMEEVVKFPDKLP